MSNLHYIRHTCFRHTFSDINATDDYLKVPVNLTFNGPVSGPAPEHRQPALYKKSSILNLSVFSNPNNNLPRVCALLLIAEIRGKTVQKM